MKMRQVLVSAAAASCLFASTQANAAIITLNFEDIAPYPSTNDVAILDYYNGGTASNGASGPNVGVSFTEGATLLCLNTATATSCSNTSKGGLGVTGSDQGAMFFETTNPFMNVAAGFDTGFSFAYSNPNGSNVSVSVYDDLDGEGALLASAQLPQTIDSGCSAAIAGAAAYCPFSDFSLSFGGTARSVLFGGTVNQQVFDDFTFGSTVVGGAVPEPATWGMMILGFGVIGAVARRRRMRPSLA